jgi:glycerophosphoryl diester phosphodiesterase
MTRPLIIAHRGGAGLWPENTLLAFTEAAKAGFDGAELDVHLTRDGKLAVFHDFRMKRGLWRQGGQTGSRLLAGLDYGALAGIEIPPPGRGLRGMGREGGAEGGRGIPLLSEVMAAVRAVRDDFLLFVEIKTASGGVSAAPEAVAEAVVDAVTLGRAWDRIVLVGFDWRALLHAKRLEPRVRCWFSTAPGMDRKPDAWAGGFHPRAFAGSFAQAIARAGGDGWFAHAAQAKEKAIADARAKGLKVGVWTVNAPARLRTAVTRAPDAICTDRPDRLAALLVSQRPSNKAVER